MDNNVTECLRKAVLENPEPSRREMVIEQVFQETGVRVTGFQASLMRYNLRQAGLVPPAKHGNWSAKKDEELRAMAGKVRAVDIQEHFGVTEVTLNNRARRLGVSLRLRGETPESVLSTLQSTEVTHG